MAHVNTKHGKKNNKKNNKIKNTKIKIKCVRGGGGNLLYLLCLISNTLPQLEQSTLQPSTVLQHRHLQTTSYQLQPSPSTPPPPHLQKRKNQAVTG